MHSFFTYLNKYKDLVMERAKSGREKVGVLVKRVIESPHTKKSLSLIEGLASSKRFERRVLVTIAVLMIAQVGVLTFEWYVQLPKRNIPVRVAGPETSFVAPQMSASANIIITLPEGVNREAAKDAIVFTPKIRGEWFAAENAPELTARQIAYAPKRPLEEKLTYAVDLMTDKVTKHGEFFVQKDPVVAFMNPRDKSEINEASSITVAFSRPMVPLTTRDVLDTKDLPVKLSPEVPGKWRWKSTRVLTFTPNTNGEERFPRATAFTLDVPSAMSYDYIQLPARRVAFETRRLRSGYYYGDGARMSGGVRDPFTVRYNQPVDLERMREGVRLSKKDTPIPVFLQYGMRDEYLNGRVKSVEDKSILSVFPVADSHGRKGRFDFNSEYVLSIKKAVPTEGHLGIEKEEVLKLNTNPLLLNAYLDSRRSELIDDDMFDPEGSLTYRFSEPVDIARAKIEGVGIKTVQYGEHCVPREIDGVMSDKYDDCPKEADKTILIVTFNPGQLPLQSKTTVKFMALAEMDGTEVKDLPEARKLTVHPALRITRTSLDGTPSKASVTNFSLCTNAPLRNYTPKDAHITIDANGYVAMGSIDTSMRIGLGADKSEICKKGEFRTNIRYGLIPKTDYQFNVRFESAFGGFAEKKLAFKTGEAPEEYVRLHNMQQGYVVASPEKSKLLFAAENLEYVNLEVCKLSAEGMLNALQMSYAPQGAEKKYDCSEIKQERIDLPKRYWVNNYFHVSPETYFPGTGHYRLTLTHPRLVDPYNKEVVRKEEVFMTVTNLIVTEKSITKSGANDVLGMSAGEVRSAPLPGVSSDAKSLYWVVQAGSLAPVDGAKVSRYGLIGKNGESISPYEDGTGARLGVVGNTQTTNKDGFAEFDPVTGQSAAVVSIGNDSAIVSRDRDMLAYAQEARIGARTYIYTDRPLYRTGDTAHVRVIDRLGYDGSYEIASQKTAKVVVRNSRGEEIYAGQQAIGEFGTMTFDIPIAKDAPLGDYSIQTLDGYGSFSVLAYKPAAFALGIQAHKPEYTAGDTATFALDAKYYFGAKVAGTFDYSIVAQDYYFNRFSDEATSFDGGWYDCMRCGYGDKFLLRGTGKIIDGKAIVTLPLDYAKYFSLPQKEGSKTVTLRATVKDNAGRTVSGSQSIIVHRGAYYLSVSPEHYSGNADEPVNLRVRSVNQKGAPIAKNGLTVTAYTSEWKQFRRREVDGSFYWGGEEVRTKVWSSAVSTDANGKGLVAFTPPKEESYIIEVSRVDESGNVIRGEARYWVWGGGDVRNQNNATLDLQIGKKEVRAGETVMLTIPSPFPRAKALVTIERGSVRKREVLELASGYHAYAIKTTALDAPNIYASVVLIDERGEVRYGQQQITVDTDMHALDIQVKSNKPEYLPGEKVVLTVSAHNSDGGPMRAEVSLAAVDLSVLALVGNPKKQPLKYFYDGFPNVVGTAVSTKNLLHERDIPTGTKGGDGGEPDDLAKKKRGDFRDTAFWSGSVLTNIAGVAEVSFTLPDNITTWQVEALGVTKDTKLGVTYKEFTAQKQVFAAPLVPRFVIAGDKFSVGAQVFNRTSGAQVFTVQIASTTLSRDGHAPVTSEIAAGASKTFWFPVAAQPDMVNGEHEIEFLVKGGGKEDAVVQKIPLTENYAAEAVQTSGVIVGGGIREEVVLPDNVTPGMGGLSVTVARSLAYLVPSAVNNLIAYPYGCNEQVASRVSALALALRIKDTIPGIISSDKKIKSGSKEYDIPQLLDAGIASLVSGQNPSGGFGFYRSDNDGGDPLLTAHVIRALKDAKIAGVIIPDGVIARAEQWLFQSLQGDAHKQSREALVIDAASAFMGESAIGESDKKKLISRLLQLSWGRSRVRALDTNSLARLAVLTVDPAYAGLKKKTFRELESRLVVDGRGAHLRSHSEYFGFGSYVSDLALFVKALSLHEENHPLMPEMLRTITSSRDAWGGFGATHQSGLVLDALAAHLARTKPWEGDFHAKSTLGSDTILDVELSGKNWATEQKGMLGVDAIAKNKALPFEITKTNGGKRESLYYQALLKYFLPVNGLSARDEGILVERELLELDGEGKPTKVVSSARVGEVLLSRVKLVVSSPVNAFALEDYIPAGFSIVNMSLSTEDKTLFEGEPKEGVMKLYGHEEKHDDRNFVFVDNLAPGVYEYTSFIRATNPGTYQHVPTQASAMYAPEIFGRSEGGEVVVKE